MIGEGWARLDFMQKLRSVHLYLGCIFAPMLLFFAVSGIWQMVGAGDSLFLQKLSTIHTQRQWKDGSGLGSVPLRLFAMVMAVSFIITTVLGIMMAFKYGRSRRAAVFSLAAGVFVPAVLILWRMFG